MAIDSVVLDGVYHHAVLYCEYPSEVVTDAEVLYGRHIMVCNMHCLIHLVEDVKCKRLGCLND